MGVRPCCPELERRVNQLERQNARQDREIEELQELTEEFDERLRALERASE